MNEADNNNNAGGPPTADEEIAEMTGRASLGDFSQSEAADDSAKRKKRKFIIGGGVALVLVILAIVLGVTLSGSGSKSTEEEQATNNMGDAQGTTTSDAADTTKNTAQEEEQKQPNMFAINDDTATFFTHSFSMGSEGTDDDAVYIPVLENDTPGPNADEIIITDIKPSTLGPNHGECMISMEFTDVVYTLTDPNFVGKDVCVYEACTKVKEDMECGTAEVTIKIEPSEDAPAPEMDPEKVLPANTIVTESVQLDLKDVMNSKDAVVDMWGDTIVVGTSYDDSWKGAVLVFVKDKDSGEYVQQAKLVAPDMYADYLGYFGWSVDIHEDTLVVGAWGDSDENAEMFNRGAAHVFVRDENGNWSHQAKLMADDGASDDYFGYDVAVFKDVAIVTSWWDDDAGEQSGSAYVFMRDDNGNWNQQVKLLAPDGDVDDSFGNSVDMHESTAIIGAWWDDNVERNTTDSGSAHIFVRDGDTWVFEAKLQDAVGEADDRFGNRVAIWKDTAVVGARGDNSKDGNDAGSAYVFIRTGDSWTSQAQLGKRMCVVFFF